MLPKDIAMCIYDSNHKSISYKNEGDITIKISIFLQITGVIGRTLKLTHVQKHTRMKIYNDLALSTSLYECETRAVREQDKSRITSAEMKFVRRTAKYRWQDYKTNEDISSEFYVVRTVHFGMKLYNNQLNAQVFNLFIYLLLPYMFRAFF
jgi:hypothetical protein